MTLYLRFTVLLAIAVTASCSDDLNNELPSEREVSQLKGRVDSLERDVIVVAENEEENEQATRLTREAMLETNRYLDTLYKNINSTRPQDLPEWQEMYVALTNESSMTDPEFGLGLRKLRTNFSRLHEYAETNSDMNDEQNDRLASKDQVDAQHDNTLNRILDRLSTIDANINELNKVVDDKFQAVDKLLSDYEGRIVGVENRMRTVEIDLDAFRGEFVEYKQRVSNIENLLKRYDLAVMSNDIRDLKQITTNHEERLIEMDGRIQINTSEISLNRTNLDDTDQELSTVSTDVGQLKVSVQEILERLESCNCFRVMP